MRIKGCGYRTQYISMLTYVPMYMYIFQHLSGIPDGKLFIKICQKLSGITNGEHGKGFYEMDS